jgi:hypothetical protein
MVMFFITDDSMARNSVHRPSTRILVEMMYSEVLGMDRIGQADAYVAQ